jgi:hypothetical protein
MVNVKFLEAESNPAVMVRFETDDWLAATGSTAGSNLTPTCVGSPFAYRVRLSSTNEVMLTTASFE